MAGEMSTPTEREERVYDIEITEEDVEKEKELIRAKRNKKRRNSGRNRNEK